MEEDDDHHDLAYHFPMLLDIRRNELFVAGVKAAVEEALKANPKPTVLDVGSGGTALLAVAAAKVDAAVSVVACEVDPRLAAAAQAAVDVNGVGDQVQVVNLHSDDLPTSVQADVMVAELFDDRLLGERIVPTFNHLHLHSANPGVITVPASATLTACVVSSATLKSMEASRCAWGVEADPVEPMPPGALPDCARLTEPFPVFELSFGAAQAEEGDVTACVPVTQAGTADAVVFWWETCLFPGVPPLSTEPSAWLEGRPPSPGNTSHWKPAVFFLDSAAVESGAVLEVNAIHNGITVAFDVEVQGTPAAVSEGAEQAPARSDGEEAGGEGVTAGAGGGVDEDGDEDEDEDEAGPFTLERDRLWIMARDTEWVTSLASLMTSNDNGVVVVDSWPLAAALDTRCCLALEGDEESVSHLATLAPNVRAVEGVGDVAGALTAAGLSGPLNVAAEPHFSALVGVASKNHALMWWWTVHALNGAGLLGPTSVVAPSRGTLRGRFVSFTSFWGGSKPLPPAVCGIDVSPMNEFVNPPSVVETHPVWHFPHTPASPPISLLTLDFLAAPTTKAAVVGVDGVDPAANALVMWMEYEAGDTRLDTGDGSRATPWLQSVLWLQAPVPSRAVFHVIWDIESGSVGVDFVSE